ncbi:MAG: hypothetical protein AAGE80_18900 [Pseudomonadota bacterium]
MRLLITSNAVRYINDFVKNGPPVSLMNGTYFLIMKHLGIKKYDKSGNLISISQSDIGLALDDDISDDTKINIPGVEIEFFLRGFDASDNYLISIQDNRLILDEIINIEIQEK